MLAKAPPLSDKEKLYQQALQNETELQGLRREFAILDSSQTHSAAPRLTKTAKVLQLFQKEHKNIEADLNVATGFANQRKDEVKFESLTRLLQEYDSHSEQIEMEKIHMLEVENQIRSISRQVQGLRKRQITDRQHEDRVRNSLQTLDNLENKLETQMIKFNVINMKNSQLRSEIDHLLWDRRNFMVVWNKLIEKLNSGKQILLDLIEQATIAYDQREDWCNKLQLMRIKGHKDFVTNIEQMRVYETKIAESTKLEEFFYTKGQRRYMRDLIRKKTLQRMKVEENLEKKIQDYQNLVKEIREFTKLTKTDAIVRFFHHREGENFTNFTQIINQMREVEVANDQLVVKQSQVEDQRLVTNKRSEQQKETLQELEMKLKRALINSKKTEEDLNGVVTKMEDLMTGIFDLFKLCNCDQDPLLLILGHNEKIKDYNVLLYLEMLEKRIQECLVKACYKENALERKSSKKLFTTEGPIPMVYGIEKIVDSHPCVLCLEHELVCDLPETIQIPLSRRQARRNLAYRLTLPGGAANLHRVSKCHLPQARKILQQKYE